MPDTETRIRLVVGIVAAQATLLAVLFGKALFAVFVGLPSHAPVGAALLPALCVGGLTGYLYRPPLRTTSHRSPHESRVALSGRRLQGRLLAWAEAHGLVTAEVVGEKAVGVLEDRLREFGVEIQRRIERARGDR